MGIIQHYGCDAFSCVSVYTTTENRSCTGDVLLHCHFIHALLFLKAEINFQIEGWFDPRSSLNPRCHPSTALLVFGRSACTASTQFHKAWGNRGSALPPRLLGLPIQVSSK